MGRPACWRHAAMLARCFALMSLGQYHSRQNEPDRAIFYYERAAGIDKFEARAKVRQAQVLVGMERYADALADQEELDRLLQLGAGKASEASRPTLEAMFDRMGFVPR